MGDALADSIDSLDIDDDTSLDLPLVLSALESIDEQNARDIADELSALAAIYDGDAGPALKLYRAVPTARKPSPPPTWTPSGPDPLRLVLSTQLDDETPLHLLLSIPYPAYPTGEPPLIQIHDRYLGKFQVSDELFGQVVRTFMHDSEAGPTNSVEWSGAVCLFEGVESVKELCSTWVQSQAAEKRRGERLRQEAAGPSELDATTFERDSKARGTSEGNDELREEEERLREPSFARMRRKPGPEHETPCPEIYSTQGLVDRKSLFVAHAARVRSIAEVEAVMSTLLSNSKIAKATHNISAYEFTSPDGIRHSDNDDDGEKAAGSTLASLLERIDVHDIVVVVSRWYGGIHLGPDRFKDINQAARDALVEGGFLVDTAEKAKTKSALRNGRSATKR